MTAWLEAALHRPLAALPVPAVGLLAQVLARGVVPRLHPRLAIDAGATLRALRPDLDADVALAAVRDNLARGFCEIPGLTRLWTGGRVGVSGTLPADRPVVVAWVHTGNPEVLGLALAGVGARPVGVAAPQPNALRARIVAAQRAAAGIRVVQGAGAMRAALRTLERRDGAVMLAVDDIAADGTVRGPSLGRPFAATGNLPLIARLAARTGAAVVPAWIERHPRARFTLHLAAPVAPDPAAIDAVLDAAVRRLMPQWWFVGLWRPSAAT